MTELSDLVKKFPKKSVKRIGLATLAGASSLYFLAAPLYFTIKDLSSSVEYFNKNPDLKIPSEEELSHTLKQTGITTDSSNVDFNKVTLYLRGISNASIRGSAFPNVCILGIEPPICFEDRPASEKEKEMDYLHKCNHLIHEMFHQIYWNLNKKELKDFENWASDYLIKCQEVYNISNQREKARKTTFLFPRLIGEFDSSKRDFKLEKSELFAHSGEYYFSLLLKNSDNERGFEGYRDFLKFASPIFSKYNSPNGKPIKFKEYKVLDDYSSFSTYFIQQLGLFAKLRPIRNMLEKEVDLKEIQ